MRHKHIVLVSQIPLWSMGKATGGPAFHNTLTALGKRFRVSLVTPALDYVHPGDLPEGVELHEFRHRLHGLWRSVRKLGWVTDTLGWYTFASSAWPIVRRLCSAGDVDLLYGYEIYGTPVARRAGDRFHLPVVARYQGTLMYRRREMPAAWLRFWKHIRALKTPADLYVMTDDGTLGDRVLQDWGAPTDRILFLMNGVDFSIRDVRTSVDARAALGIAADVPMLLTVSRLSHWKRVDRSIEALALLRAGGVPAQLVVVGTGPEEAGLRALAVANDVAEAVHFVGGVAREELIAYYRAADALLSLYDFSNLANPVLEAMMIGVPVIALDEGGTSNLVLDGVNGVLLKDGSPASVAASVAGLLGDAGRREALGRSAARWAEKNLRTWDARMAVEIEALERLLERHGS